MKTLHLSIIVVLIVFTSVLFVWITWFNNETLANKIQVNGKVITNSTTIPRFIFFVCGTSTTTVKVDSGSYSVSLPNDCSYEVSIDYADKNPPVIPNNTLATERLQLVAGRCFIGTFNLHAKAHQLDYDVLCPKI